MFKWLAPLFILLLSLVSPAEADSLVVATCGTLPLAYAPGATRFDTVDVNGNKCISGNISTSISGFTPNGNYATLTATGSSARVALPTGTVVVAYNTGTTAVSCILGSGSVVAVANEDQIQPAGWFSYTVGANADIACIDQTGSASNLVIISGGAGIASGAGGGGAAGSSSITTWAGGTLGAMANYGTSPGAVLVPGVNASVTASALPTGASTAANQATEISSLATIATNTGAATPAGTAIIGKVGIDQTAPGTTNGVQVNAALPAGTNTVGTVGQLPYPVGSTPYTATATGTTGATTATLAGASSVTTYLCGFSIRANATAAATGNATVTGVITATLNFTQWTAPNASGLGITEMIFAPCIPASGTNQSVAVVSAAPGTGGVVSVTAWGYKL